MSATQESVAIGKAAAASERTRGAAPTVACLLANVMVIAMRQCDHLRGSHGAIQGKGFPMARDVTVFEVLYYAGDDGPSGPAADGHFVWRSRDRREAERFAAARTCYGSPATVSESSVPRRLAQRWGVA